MADKTFVSFFLDDVGPYATGVPRREKEMVPVDAAALQAKTWHPSKNMLSSWTN